MTVRVPDSTHRTMIIGRTGSGKSQFGLFALSLQDFYSIPWVIIDYKGEDLIRDIMRQNKGAIQTLKPTDSPPKRPGLYYMRPTPRVDDVAVEEFLWACHKRGSIGLFIDEGYMLPDIGAYTALLTQGRSLHIPIICLYQRPVWMNRFAVAQADFICAFKQHDLRDDKVSSNFVPPYSAPNGEILNVTSLKTLPDYSALWHDVGRGQTALLRPAPDRAEILRRYKERLTPRSHRSFV